MFKKLVVTLLAGSCFAEEVFEPAATGKCHAIAFSSGDEDAAYQAGVLKGITTNPKLSAADWAYDSVSGVSG